MAYLLKHPALGPRSVEYGFSGGGGMGRSTPPLSASFEEAVSRLRREFRDALMDRNRREAFDSLPTCREVVHRDSSTGL